MNGYMNEGVNPGSWVGLCGHNRQTLPLSAHPSLPDTGSYSSVCLSSASFSSWIF